jgi:hypothetical protein
MFNIKQFRELIIQPVLNNLQMYSDNAEELLVFTCATESKGGTYLHQVKGRALGIYQCEPSTYSDLWNNYILHRHSLLMMLSLNFNAPRIPDPSRLIYDLHFATAMCRIDYRRESQALPEKNDIDGIWDYYKSYYNSALGKATKDKSIAAYNSFIGAKKT